MGIFGHGLGSGFRDDSDDGGGGTLSGILGAVYGVETGSDVAAATGSVASNINVTGWFITQEAATLDTAAISGSWSFIDPVTGTMAPTEGAVDSVAFTVFVSDGIPVTGTMAATDPGPDLADIPGAVFYPPSEGTMEAFETGDDTLAISATVATSPNITASMDASEEVFSDDDMAATGTVAFVDPVTVALAVTEAFGNDAFAASGTVNVDPPITATLAATETGADTMAVTADVAPVAGTMAATESGADTFAASGTIGGINVTGTMAPTESGLDTMAVSASITFQNITGTLAVTESAALDTMSTTGGFVADGPNLTGTLDVTEAFGADTMSTTGGNVSSNTAPVITSNGGGATASITVGVGDTFITQVQATDDGPPELVYSIPGGTNAALFQIDSETGVLTSIDPMEQPVTLLGDEFDNGSGGAPDGWTARFVTANVTWTEQAGGYAQAVTVTSSSPRLLAFDDIGTAENIEVLLKLRAPSSQAANGQYGGVVLRGSGTDTTYTGYRIQMGRNSGNTTNTLICSRWVSGTNTSITSPAFAWTTGNLYWIRARVNGTTIQARIWLDGEAEPGTWLVNTTDANVTGAGWAGLLVITSGQTIEYHDFYYALNGDTATTGGGSGDPYEVIVRATDGPGLFDEQTLSITVDVVPTGTMAATESGSDTASVSGNVETPPTIMFEWDVDEGTGQTLADETGQSRPGQLGSTTGAEGSDPTWDTTLGVTYASGDYIRNQGSAAFMNGLGGGTYVTAMTMPSTIVNGGTIIARDDSSGSTRQFRLYTTTAGAVEFIGYAGGATAGAGSTLTSASSIVTGSGVYLFQVQFELDDVVKVWVSNATGARTLVIDSTRSNGTMSDALTTPVSCGSSLNGTTGANTMTGAKTHYVAGHVGTLDATGLQLAWDAALAVLNAKGISLGSSASIPGNISNLSVTDGTTTSLDVTYTPASGAQTHQYRIANHGPTVSKSILWDQWRTDGGWAPVESGSSARCPAIGAVNRFIKAEEDIKTGKKAFVLEIVEYNRVSTGWLAGGVADDGYSGGQLGTGGTTSVGVTHTGIWRNGSINSSAVVWPDFTFGGGNVGQKLLVLVDMATRNVWFQNLTTGATFGDPVAGTNGQNVTGTGAIIPTLQNNNCLANVRMDTWCKGVTLPSGYSALGKSGIPPRPIYVTKSGNDTTGNGTVGAPYLTIAAGIADLGPGETVWVGDGVYDEKITITRSGCTAGAPARVMAMNQHLAILRESTDSQTYAVAMGPGAAGATSAAYNQIIGFDIDGSSSETTRRGVNMTSTGQVTARCKVHDIRVTAAADSTGGGGIVTNGGFYQSGAHYIDDCIIYRVNNGAGDRLHNIYFQTLAGRVSNNMSFLGRGGAHSEGIATWHDNKNTLFSHNLCYNNRTHGFNWGAGDIYNDPTMSGHIYINNIAYNNPSNGYIQRQGGIGVIGANQGLRLVAFDNDAGNYNNMTAGGSTNTLTITTSPSFVNYLADGTGDYHPTSTGNQVNAGTSLPSTNTTGSYNLPWRDLDGHVRTGTTPDIGPYEYRPTGTFGTATTLSGDTITGLSSSTSYEVQVRGVNSVGNGNWSNSDTESTW